MGLYDDCPCKDCVPPKRHPGCHRNCKEKDEWNDTVKAAKDAIITEQKRHDQATGFLVESQFRVAKRLKLNRWR